MENTTKNNLIIQTHKDFEHYSCHFHNYGLQSKSLKFYYIFSQQREVSKHTIKTLGSILLHPDLTILHNCTSEWYRVLHLSYKQVGRYRFDNKNDGSSRSQRSLKQSFLLLYSRNNLKMQRLL